MSSGAAAALRGLYAITPETSDDERLVALVQAALAGGAALVQYRNKNSPPAERRRQAQKLAALCRARGVPLIVNDDPCLALEAGAEGAHLGRDDGDPARARALLRGKLLGVSCYDSLEAARAALAAGADYVAFGSVFASPTKPAAVRAPLALFAAARALGVPLAAIGGITLENAPGVLAAGADLLAVITDLFEAPDVAARARAYGRLFAHEITQ
jgi:thiamine-phosphate pyrophosphorylase